MKHYVDTTGQLFAFESDGSQDFLITPSMTAVSDSQADAIRRPQPTPEQKAQSLRLERDQLLLSTDWLVNRHREQQDAGTGTTLTEDQFQELLRWRSALRRLPSTEGFPHIELPIAPAFVDLSAASY